MDNKEKQVKDLKKEIVSYELGLSDLYEALGEAALTCDKESIDSSLASDIMHQIEVLDKETNNERNRINEILSAVERADEIEAVRSRLIDQIKQLEKDNILNYETIGRASYEAYRGGELPPERYGSIFSNIVRQKSKIEELEFEKNHLEEDKSGGQLFKKIKTGARLLYLKNAIAGHYRVLQRDYRKAGEEICHSDLIMNLEAESVKQSVKPVQENLEGMEKLEEENRKLSSETEKLKGNLENLGAGSNAVKKVEEIEDHINMLYFDRKEKLQEAGSLLYLNQKDPLAKKQKIKGIIADIKKQFKNIQSAEKEIERVKAEMEIEKQSKEIEQLNKKINGYEEKIKNYSKEANHLKEKINSAANDIKQLETATDEGDKTDG